ncbi:MAG: DDE-type integrase/transposase/recombinase [Flavimaricola sp.]|nr:DDE-type integrase/transposase/recombinase [Flavimaricola sp.]
MAEVVVSFRGKNWLWRAIDADGDVLNILVQMRRNANNNLAMPPRVRTRSHFIARTRRWLRGLRRKGIPSGIYRSAW